MNRSKLQRLRDIFFAALLIEGEKLENWCKKRNLVYSSVLRWIYNGFPPGTTRRNEKSKKTLQEILITIDKAGLSGKVDPFWRNYYDFDS
jgi:hypothetical protein